MDTTPLLSEPEDGSIQESPYHLPQPLRGPSLDELAGCGVDVRSPGDDITTTGIDFRDYTSLSTNVQLDRLKEHEEHEPTVRKVVFSPDATTADAVPLDIPRRNPIRSASTYSNQDLSDLDSVSTSARHDGHYTSASIEDRHSRPVPSFRAGTGDVTTQPPSGEIINADESVHPPHWTSVAPPLSEGKRYHVFFSYEISDREWVEEVTRRLESPEMGFRCSMHERDFHGGKRIIENITEHIRLSEKTVLVLSPDFIQSHWCMFEIEMGMILSMEESQLLVVPVMVKRCFVPDSIKTLTYIDATPGNDWWQRFIGAIVSKEDLRGNLTGTKELRIEPRHGNMDALVELSSNFKCPLGEQLRTPYIPEPLLRQGVQVPPDEFQQSMDIIRSARCWCAVLCDNGPCCVPTFTILLLAGISTVALGVIAKGEPPLIMIFPVFFTSLWLFFALTFCIQRRIRRSRLRKAVAEVNAIFLKYNVIVGYKMQTAGCILTRTYLQFWFYNPTECKNLLANFLEGIEGRHLASGSNADKASQLFQHHCLDYTSAYNEGQLKVKHGARHVRNAICLCQFVEDKYSEGQRLPIMIV
ncbi:uncharacterized protein LOC124272339 [Haliotis rubra]|uniref:uncharacterized protein LOC124272339 n=1 Tax=Haliotis rubra TaxID=36100 RepID=UPI001EE5D766|nr:uncharacterized protein LOC124272339 [Haliotis rubra]